MSDKLKIIDFLTAMKNEGYETPGLSTGKPIPGNPLA